VLIIKLVYVPCKRTALGTGKQTNSIPYYATPYLEAAGLLSEYFANIYMHVQVLNLLMLIVVKGM